MVQDAVMRLRDMGELSDQLDPQQLTAATAAIDALEHPLSSGDIGALLALLPEGGDTASGLNWTIVHAIEASPAWPLCETLKSDRSKWVQILRLRLANAGELPATD